MKTVIALLLVTCAIGCGNDDSYCPSGADYYGSKGVEDWCATTNADGQTVRHGPYREWWESGQLKTEGQYTNGTKTGYWRYWYSDGQPHQTGSWNEHGEKCGLFVTYDDAGSVIDETWYDAC